MDFLRNPFQLRGFIQGYRPKIDQGYRIPLFPFFSSRGFLVRDQRSFGSGPVRSKTDRFLRVPPPFLRSKNIRLQTLGSRILPLTSTEEETEPKENKQGGESNLFLT